MKGTCCAALIGALVVAIGLVGALTVGGAAGNVSATSIGAAP